MRDDLVVNIGIFENCVHVVCVEVGLGDSTTTYFAFFAGGGTSCVAWIEKRGMVGCVW